MSRTRVGHCVHCGNSTFHAWMDTRSPKDGMTYVCLDCMREAEVGHYCTPAYERVGQKTYSPLLKPEGESSGEQQQANQENQS